MKSYRLCNPKNCLTFDYELFLGRSSGSLDKCIIEPTNKILKLIKLYSATAIFFIDATFLNKLKNNDSASYKRISNQINEMLDNGCEIGLHLHPHWLDSINLQDGTWSLKNDSRYRLHALESDILQQIFDESLDTLTNIINKTNRSYKLDMFRAGGWCIQPFSQIRCMFEKFGINFDYSVTPGLYKNNLPSHFYDYRSVPTDLSIWRFTNDPCEPEVTGRFFEIPVTHFTPSPASLILNRISIKNDSIFGDGQGVSKGRIKEITSKIFSLKSPRQLTLDMCSRHLLDKSMRDTSGRSFRVFASHPKMFSVTSLKNLEYLLYNHETLSSTEMSLYV